MLSLTLMRSRQLPQTLSSTFGCSRQLLSAFIKSRSRQSSIVVVNSHVIRSVPAPYAVSSDSRRFRLPGVYCCQQYYAQSSTLMCSINSRSLSVLSSVLSFSRLSVLVNIRLLSSALLRSRLLSYIIVNDPGISPTRMSLTSIPVRFR